MENSDPNNTEIKQPQPQLTTNYGESQILNNNQSQISHNQPQQSLSFKETLYLQQHLLQSGNQQILIQNQITGIHQGQNQYQKYEQNHQMYQAQSNPFQNQYGHNQEYGRHNLDSNYSNNQYENYNQQNYQNQYERENTEQKMVDQENQYQENQTQTFEQFGDAQHEEYTEHQDHQNHNYQQELQLNQNYQHEQRHLQIEQPVSTQPNGQTDAKLPLPSQQQHIKQVDNSSVSFNQFTVYQNQILEQMKQKQIKQVKKSESIEQKKQPIQQKQQSSSQNIKKSKKKKKKDQGQPLPVISANSQQGKKQIMSDKKVQQKKIVSFDPPKRQTNPAKKQADPETKKVSSTNLSSNTETNKKLSPIKQESRKVSSSNPSDNSEPNKKPSPIKQERMSKQQQSIVLNRNVSQPQEQVSQIINPTSASAGVIIFEAQRQRIASTLQYFLKFVLKHQKHTMNQKQIITNIEQEMQKKRISKQLIANALKDYFNDVESMCKQFYQKSYKYVKNQKIINPNPMINMREQLKTGYDQMIFLRKSTGNDFHRIGDFVNSTIQRNIVKTFTQYWNAVSNAQNKNKQKKQDFYKKQKELSKRISKVQKVYTKGKQGISQQEDLFIQMTKYISQEKQYRKSLIQYGLGLIPMKKAFIKAQQTLYEQLQAIFNSYKNQCRSLFAMHPKQFTQIQKYQKLVKERNTFQKLSDITDGDYVRSVLVAVQKTSIQNLTDKDFQKVFNMVHFQQIVGSPIELLKGTTSKSFQLKNKAEQVVDTISGNLLIFNKQTAQMKEKFVIKNINAKIVQEGVVQIDQVLKGFLFDSNRTFRITFRDNDRAEELICFLNQLQESIETALQQNKK